VGDPTGAAHPSVCQDRLQLRARQPGGRRDGEQVLRLSLAGLFDAVAESFEFA
jgi:hypothetical protein